MCYARCTCGGCFVALHVPRLLDLFSCTIEKSGSPMRVQLGDLLQSPHHMHAYTITVFCMNFNYAMMHANGQFDEFQQGQVNCSSSVYYSSFVTVINVNNSSSNYQCVATLFHNFKYQRYKDIQNFLLH